MNVILIRYYAQGNVSQDQYIQFIRHDTLGFEYLDQSKNFAPQVIQLLINSDLASPPASGEEGLREDQDGDQLLPDREQSGGGSGSEEERPGH